MSGSSSTSADHNKLIKELPAKKDESTTNSVLKKEAQVFGQRVLSNLLKVDDDNAAEKAPQGRQTDDKTYEEYQFSERSQGVTIVPKQDEQLSDDKKYHGYNFSAMRRELTLDKLWYRRTWGEIFKHFFTALMISAIPTFYDIFTDSFAAKSFIQGANYTKYVTNLSDPTFHENCVYLGRTGEYEEIECFETDII